MTTHDARAIWAAQLADMPIQEVCDFLRGLGYNVSDNPREWWEYHHRHCGTCYRGCAPDCPKDMFERTGEWIGPGCVALPIRDDGVRERAVRFAQLLSPGSLPPGYPPRAEEHPEDRIRRRLAGLCGVDEDTLPFDGDDRRE